MLSLPDCTLWVDKTNLSSLGLQPISLAAFATAALKKGENRLQTRKVNEKALSFTLPCEDVKPSADTCRHTQKEKKEMVYGNLQKITYILFYTKTDINY